MIDKGEFLIVAGTMIVGISIIVAVTPLKYKDQSQHAIPQEVTQISQSVEYDGKCREILIPLRARISTFTCPHPDHEIQTKEVNDREVILCRCKENR